jgi:hypothetical protein
MEKSISRLIADIDSSTFKNLDNYQLSIQLRYILERNLSLTEFGQWFISVDNMLKNYNKKFYEYFIRLGFFKNNIDLCTTFFKYCNGLRKTYHLTSGLSFVDNISNLELLMKSNEIGPVCFVTPELGRWSTVGGLGVMVDELSQGLVQLGQEVIIISPYYERNKKGETGYLSRDPAGFSHIGNIDVTLDQKYTFGIHYGVVNGCKLYFLHNYDIFPTAYAEGVPSFVLKQICLMSKAALEMLCFISVVPALVVTNDWFTGLCAAYSKTGHFGDTFKGTTFFHIVHNLEPTYEGRIYPSTNEGVNIY